MHKKRAVIVTIFVLIVILALVFTMSEYHYRKNSEILINALKVMRVDPEQGFELCSQVTINDYARDCYTAYLSVEIENAKVKYGGYGNMSTPAGKEAAINILNEVTDKMNRVCYTDVMLEEGETCSKVQIVLDYQKDKVLDS